MIRTRYHPIPLAGGVPKTYWNGLLVVGDAASHVKPTTGGGLVMGMTCARIAGSVAATSVRRRCYSEDFLSSYHATWRKEIGFDLDIMRHLRKIFLTLSDEALNKIISTGIKLKIDEQMENVESIDFQGRTLLKVIRSPKSLLLLLYLLTHSLAKCGGERGGLS